MIDRLVVFGAVGDLVGRHMLPALAHLIGSGRLPSNMSVQCIGRENLTIDGYRALAESKLAEHASDVESTHRASLLSRLTYLQADLLDEPDLGVVLGKQPVVAYLALPPSAYAHAVKALQAGGMALGSRVVVEKPYGTDAASAKELNRLLRTVVEERDIFRVDHFLYHQVVQDLFALRFATPIFEPLWNKEHIAKIEIIWEEASGVGGRTDFYDQTGALKDMIQSHLLQVLALIAMDAPEEINAELLRTEKSCVLRNIPSLTSEQVSSRTARGRYTSGETPQGHYLAYTLDPGIQPSRDTETYAYVELNIDLDRWRGVPFVLRTGKALGEARRRIAVHFRPNSGSPLTSCPAVLAFEMAPDRLTLELAAISEAGLPTTQPVSLGTVRARQGLPASARMMLDVLAGDPTLFVRDDEVVECWRVVDSIVATWRQGAPPLQEYQAGSAGPACPG